MADITVGRGFTSDNLHFGARALGWLALVASLSACSGSVSSADSGSAGAAPAAIAPAPPAVPPELPDVSASDRNRDRIDDAFEASDDAAVVHLEVILNAPTLDRHLAAFTRSGGHVDHVFRAVSYGFTGTLAHGKLAALAGELGPDLRLIAAPKPVSLFLDEATRTGRVRPVWAANFAGVTSGFSGDPNITIAILDTGVDATHPDLSGAMIGYTDYTADNNQTAADVVGHGTHVASIAVGTGAAFGIGPGTLRYTTTGSLSGIDPGAFTPGVIHTPNYFGGNSTLSVSSSTVWLGGASTTFYLLASVDADSAWTPFANSTGASPRSIGVSNLNNAPARFSDGLSQPSSGMVGNFSVANAVANYPAVGDGFGALRGVAPNCKWYGGKVFTSAGAGNSADIGKALDDMVVLRSSKNIKVVNMSLGVGGGGTDVGLRAKANTLVDNGIVVVVAAGNDGPSGTIGDPGRAAKVITIGGSNDKNELTTYTSKGSSTLDQNADYKPDLLAPGGSVFRSMILAADSNSSDASSSTFADQVHDDYTALQGTSMASPFAAGVAALLIDALQKSGETWSLSSNQQPLLVKMLMLASASETNTGREQPATTNSPTLGRAAAPKDLYEGFGLLNPDAAIEAISRPLPKSLTGSVSNTAPARLEWERRAWGRRVALSSGSPVSISLSVPSSADFDLYLYAGTPDASGNPVIRASSTSAGLGSAEAISFTPSSSETGYVFVKRVSGFGTFSLSAVPGVDEGGSGGMGGSGGTGAGGAGSGATAGATSAGGAAGASASLGGGGAGGFAAGGASGGELNENGGKAGESVAATAGTSAEAQSGNAGVDAGAPIPSEGGRAGAGVSDAGVQGGETNVVPVAGPSSSHVDPPSGCGCAEAGSKPSATSGLWLLAALALAGTRRRRAAA